jgi:hypothetical protein
MTIQTFRFRAICITLAVACGGAPREATDTVSAKQPTPAAATWTVRPDSFGAVPLGVPLAQAAAALVDSTLGAQAGSGCGLVRPATLPPGTSLMYIGERGAMNIERVNVDSTGVFTAEGVGVGDTQARVREVYGERTRVEPHKYVPQGHNIVVNSLRDTLYRIVFETDGQRVVRYRAGRRPAVDLVEKCG